MIFNCLGCDVHPLGNIFYRQVLFTAHPKYDLTFFRKAGDAFGNGIF
jgi:hypothetical protein